MSYSVLVGTLPIVKTAFQDGTVVEAGSLSPQHRVTPGTIAQDVRLIASKIIVLVDTNVL